MFKKKPSNQDIYDESVRCIDRALSRYRDDILWVEDSTLLLEKYIEELAKIKAYLESEIKKSREQIRKNHKIASNLSQLIEEN
jgi:hypothetical protein